MDLVIKEVPEPRLEPGPLIVSVGSLPTTTDRSGMQTWFLQRGEGG
jgi:hypothetical protein